jgi:hypothetical protein
MMKRRILSIASAITFVVLLIPAGQMQATPDHEIRYDVIYDCVCGPCAPDLEGQWWLSCDDSFVGWGWEPGHNCSRTETVDGISCENWCMPCDPH